LLRPEFLLVVCVYPVDNGISLCTVHGGGANVVPLVRDDPCRVMMGTKGTESIRIGNFLYHIGQIVSLKENNENLALYIHQYISLYHLTFTTISHKFPIMKLNSSFFVLLSFVQASQNVINTVELQKKTHIWKHETFTRINLYKKPQLQVLMWENCTIFMNKRILLLLHHSIKMAVYNFTNRCEQQDIFVFYVGNITCPETGVVTTTLTALQVHHGLKAFVPHTKMSSSCTSSILMKL
jgi:hypothetical protein